MYSNIKWRNSTEHECLKILNLTLFTLIKNFTIKKLNNEMKVWNEYVERIILFDTFVAKP